MNPWIRRLRNRLWPCCVLVFLVLAASPEFEPGLEAQQAVVWGTVMEDDTEQPVSGVELILSDATEEEVLTRTYSDDVGVFQLNVPEPPSDAVYLTVRRIGYETVGPYEMTLQQVDEVELSIRLAPEAVVLDAITVVVERGAGWGRWAEFEARAERNQQFGRGRIYTRVDLDRIRPASVSELVGSYGWGGQCTPTVFLNGIPMGNSFYMVQPHQLAGLEFYRDRDPIPAEYYRVGMCGVVLLWTRYDSADRPWSWARVGVAGGILSLILLWH